MMRIPLDDAYWKMYTIVIQAGAILALMLLYMQRIIGFVHSFPRGESGDRTTFNHPLSMTFFAFICTSVPALILKKWSDKHLGSLIAIALALLIGGVAMWAIDSWTSRFEPTTNHVEEMGLGQAIWIGICQSLSAIFPGLSRSMSTIASGQIAGMSRPSALEFSFLLSIPTMLAATGYDLIKEVHGSKAAAAVGEAAAHVTMNSERWGVLGIGFIVSFIVALGVVEWFLMWVRKHGFTVFAVYRIIIGIVLLIWGAKLIGG